eukprot:TRINITY_DN8477_c0_g1_i1.p1 TRINITY_DN8477_c0_g1~~TRINITY_DN8477_c0_g1_i1.p1  ORF type:complete len:387 (+),score=36.39 TRINITY_DN8477_c0_g1_i1:28-1161(+)
MTSVACCQACLPLLRRSEPALAGEAFGRFRAESLPLCGTCLGLLAQSLAQPAAAPLTAPRLRALCYVSKELSAHAVTWEESAKRNGYEYEIIGLRDAWHGLENKIRRFRSYLVRPYIDASDWFVVTDGLDAFFLAEPAELLYKAQTILDGRELLIGTTSVDPNRCNEKTVGSKLLCWTRVMGSADKPYAMLNGGLILGTKRALLQLYSWMLRGEFGQDQFRLGAYLREHPNAATMDYEQIVFTNPRLPFFDDECEYFQGGSGAQRIRVRKTGTTPCVVHLPGTTGLAADQETRNAIWAGITEKLGLPHMPFSPREHSWWDTWKDKVVTTPWIIKALDDFDQRHTSPGPVPLRQGPNERGVEPEAKWLASHTIVYPAK